MDLKEDDRPYWTEGFPDIELPLIQSMELRELVFIHPSAQIALGDSHKRLETVGDSFWNFAVYNFMEKVCSDISWSHWLVSVHC